MPLFPGDSFLIPTQIKTTLEETDHLLVVDAEGILSKIKKADLIADLLSVTTPTDNLFSSVVFLCHFESLIDEKNNTIINNGALISSDAKFGNGALLLNGSGYISIADSSSLRFNTSDFAIECFLHFDNLAGYQTILDKGYVGAGGMVIQTGNGTGRFIVYINGNIICAESGTNSTGIYYFYQFIRSGSSIKIFRDGIQVASGNTSISLDNTSDINIGAGRDGGNLVTFFKGKIDEFRITKASRNPNLPTSAFPNS